MLGNINLDDKGYDRIRAEAVARIPVYNREWTNFNISDPGITILENFSAFIALQQSEMNEIPEKIRMRLLALVGFTAGEGRCARAYLMPENVAKPCLPPPRMKLYAQDICFELEECAAVRDMRILSIKKNTAKKNTAKKNSAQITDSDEASALLGRHGVKGGLALFGEQPAGGETVSFSVSGFPDAGQKAALYIEIEQQFERNPFSPDMDAVNPFAELLWEVGTDSGFEALVVEDGTHCFLQSGYVVFSVDEELRGSLVRSGADNAYQMRVTLARSDYDIVPRVRRVCGLLTPAVQRDTRSAVQQLPAVDGKVRVTDYLLQNDWNDAGYLEVYGKEADGAYHRYHDLDRMNAGTAEQTRVYHAARESAFTTVLTLARYDASASEELPAEALVVCRDTGIAAYGSLGRLYGYDSQEMALPDLEEMKICSRGFSVLVVERRADGDEICHVVRPGDRTAGEVCYDVSEADGVLTVRDCGRYEGAGLRLGTVAFYRGDGGNIRAGTPLQSADSGLSFVNCADTDIAGCTAGSFAEDFEQVRKRFVQDLAKPVTMITRQDCEYIVKNTPGLSIHKIGVCPSPERNEIRVTVKPNSAAPFPRLSDIYQREIRRCVERSRMLTTKVLIRQPVYVPIHVRGVVSVRKHFARGMEKIEEMLRKKLDGVRSGEPFGSRIVFYELYNSLREMDCVEEVIDLSVFPENEQWAYREGMDIQLEPDALYFPGEIHMESVGKQEF